MKFSRIPEVVADLPVLGWTQKLQAPQRVSCSRRKGDCRAGSIRMGSRNLYESIAILASLKRL